MANIARTPNYSDLDLDFIAHPTTGDIVRKTGDDAIKRSVRNLILTNFYDRPFRPYIGSNVQKLLFDLATPLTAGFLKDAIVEVITNYEPRIKLDEVVVSPDEDGNAYNISIRYEILNRGEPAIISLFLERIR